MSRSTALTGADAAEADAAKAEAAEVDAAGVEVAGVEAAFAGFEAPDEGVAFEPRGAGFA